MSTNDKAVVLTPKEQAMRDVIKSKEQALRNQQWTGRLTASEKALVWHFARAYGLDLNLGHLVILGGKPYVTVAGMLHHAHAAKINPLCGIDVEIIEEHKGEYAKARAVVKRLMGVGATYVAEYKGYGEATPDTIGLKNGARHVSSMAQTRAIGRALRAAFSISSPAFEELDLQDEQAVMVSQAVMDAKETAPEEMPATEAPILPAKPNKLDEFAKGEKAEKPEAKQGELPT